MKYSIYKYFKLNIIYIIRLQYSLIMPYEEPQMPFKKRESQNKREFVTSQILESIQKGGKNGF
jgi:hypothetical protein